MKKKDKIVTEDFNKVNTLLEGTKMVGDIITNSPFKINGVIEGNFVSKSNIEIGKSGVIRGNINCVEADIEGIIEGTLKVSGLLTLRKSSKVTGDILTNKLHIEEGAIFIGECKMGDNNTITRKNEKDSSLKTETQV